MKKRIAFIICMIISISMFASACGVFDFLGKKDYPDPKVTLDNLLEAMAEGDMETVSEIAGEQVDFDLSDYDEQTKDIMLHYFDQITVEVNGEPEYKGKKVELSVTFTSPDFNKSLAAVIDNENNDFVVLKVKDILLATINGEDTTALEEQMVLDFLEETKAQMTDPANQTSTESPMKMVLNKAGDAWIIEEISEDFIDPESLDADSIEMSLAIEKAITDAIPAALDLLLEEGSIEQDMYDALKAAM